jgi:hypothetical protein
MKTLVIAGNYNQAMRWINSDITAKEKSGKWKSVSDYLVVSSPDQLRGMRDPTGIFVGTWKQRTDIFELLNHLLVIMTHNTDKHKIIQDLLVQHIIEETK